MAYRSILAYQTSKDEFCSSFNIMAGIYIHIPFCKQACSYCNFYFTTSAGNKRRMIEALLSEIELSKAYLNGETIETLYIGGGTPSLLSGEELTEIRQKLEEHYSLGRLQEFTLEANPDDLSKEKTGELKSLCAAGLNRLSVGIQSFSNEDLRYMNRAHNAVEAIDSIKRLQDAGFENLTMDLIYGTPTMNDGQWETNLETAFNLNVPHISSYALTLEPKTLLDKKISRGEAKPLDEEQSARQFKILMQQMKAAGYEQYEISNFAKPGRYAIHNSNYWLGKKYIGLGPSAHSFNGHSRRWNIANNVNYINGLAEGRINYEEEILSESQKVNEQIMTSIRTQWGLSFAHFPPLIAGSITEQLKTVNPLFYIYKDKTLTLTDEGKFFADGIAATLFVE
jgi:oxygen-independent coproporphyrinogen III oxidase